MIHYLPGALNGCPSAAWVLVMLKSAYLMHFALLVWNHMWFAREFCERLWMQNPACRCVDERLCINVSLYYCYQFPASVIKTFYMDLCVSLCLWFACHKSPWHPMEGIALTWCSSNLSFCLGNKPPLKKWPHKNGVNSELFVFLRSNLQEDYKFIYSIKHSEVNLQHNVWGISHLTPININGNWIFIYSTAHKSSPCNFYSF